MGVPKSNRTITERRDMSISSWSLSRSRNLKESMRITEKYEAFCLNAFVCSWMAPDDFEHLENDASGESVVQKWVEELHYLPSARVSESSVGTPRKHDAMGMATEASSIAHETKFQTEFI